MKDVRPEGRPPTDTPANHGGSTGVTVQLKERLRGATFAQGEAALAPVQHKGGGGTTQSAGSIYNIAAIDQATFSGDGPIQVGSVDELTVPRALFDASPSLRGATAAARSGGGGAAEAKGGGQALVGKRYEISQIGRGAVVSAGSITAGKVGEVAGKKSGPVQKKGDGPAKGDVHTLAQRGTESPSGALPHQAAIQRSFGRFDVGGIEAHTGGPAREAAEGMGARAFATGHHVVFGGAPDLHTAAHEAAHVVQQRAGVQLAGGVGAAGDPYERHADLVADAVVRGESAEPLLASGPSGGGGGPAVQRAPEKPAAKGSQVADKIYNIQRVNDATMKGQGPIRFDRIARLTVK